MLRISGCLALISLCLSAAPREPKQFRAGAAAVNVSPPKLPVIVNGMFLERIFNTVLDPVYARSVVLDDGKTRLAIVLVDSCMMPRELLDEAKALASQKTGIPIDHMLVSATHTHSAPSAMGALGTPADEDYAKFLPGRLAEAIERAAQNLQPAKVGWASVDDFEHTHCRRWIYQPDKMLTDPFGNRSVRANMHPGYQNPNAIAPSGPVDPGLSVIALQTAAGQPLALVANYSMHYFGSGAVSADYYGRFANIIAKEVGGGPGFVAMMTQGTSGDQMWMDYGKPKSSITLDEYSEAVAQSAMRAYRKVQYQPWVDLKMAEARLSLGRRTPDAERLAWAQGIAAKIAGKPKNQQEVYALEQIALHETPRRELKLQAVRIGEAGITAIPNEVFAITGLKLKTQSPLPFTFNIELANGGEGYIPPPEQHKLGGYTTWPARTAALEVEAEPKIVEGLLGLLERVSGQPRRRAKDDHGSYARAVLASRPAAYWRMSESSGRVARDASGNNLHASYEDGVALYLPGPESAAFSGMEINRASHLAGGRVVAKGARLGTTYSVELWFWNGLPAEARDFTGYLFGRGMTETLGIGGKSAWSGRLVLGNGGAGSTVLSPKTWNHVALVNRGGAVAVYLNGNATPELSGEVPPAEPPEVFIGGRPDGNANFEGKVDEVAVYRRALQPKEIADHFAAAKIRR